MKVTNLLQLTEHHRFFVTRYFGLSPLDSRLLWTAYQPLIGGGALALYTTLYSSTPSEHVGESETVTLGQLFLACGMPPNEQGRKQLVDDTSRLEAVGLLKTLRHAANGEISAYEFRLQPPLAPDQFFDVHHLWLLLQERLGHNGAEAIRRMFLARSLGHPEDESEEDISAPFYEVFRMSVGTPAGTEEASVEPEIPVSGPEFGRDGFRADELLRRFPRSSPHRRAVERLVGDAALLALLNYHAGRFELTLKQAVSLLDEEGMFAASGEWSESRFQERSAEIYRGANEAAQRRSRIAHRQEVAAAAAETETALPAAGAERDVPMPYWLEVPAQFEGECDVRQYNTMLANEPYTRVLKRFFSPSAVPPAVEETFVTMKVNYQLPDEVINVMIHYLRVNDLDWNRKFLDSIAGNLAGKRIRRFEHAVTHFFRKPGPKPQQGKDGDTAKTAAPQRTQQTRRGRPPAKPVIPVARAAEKPDATEEDIQRLMEMAKRLTDG